MEFKAANDVLKSEGLQPPDLRVLVPNEQLYKALIFQPEGTVVGDANGVRHHDRDRAHLQFKEFLRAAVEENADLVITPEYSTPWETLIVSLEENNRPQSGRIWILGCESIKYSELPNYQTRLSSRATVLWEHLDDENDKFLDPLVYVFQCSEIGGTVPNRLVVLIQFKTFPSGDKMNFETRLLHRGKSIYTFGGTIEIGRAHV